MKNTVILGASQGLGLALARHYLAQGHHVWLCARNVDALRQSDLAQVTQAHIVAIDITHTPPLKTLLETIARIDILIVTAGVYYNTRSHLLDAQSAMAMLSTNISALVNAFESAGARMLAQGHGHLVAVSSIAGLMPDYPGASAYSATKRSVLTVCEAYRTALQPLGIAVTAIVPGYIDTQRLRQLNNGDARSKPFLMSEAHAVARIAQAIQTQEAVAIFPRRMKWLIWLAKQWPIWPLVALFLGRNRRAK